MGFTQKGECRNTGKTHFKEGYTPWNKGLKGVERLHELKPKVDGRLKGHPHTEETKKLMSIMRKGKSPWSKGKKFSKEHREKISASVKKNPTVAWSYKRWMAELPKMIITAIEYKEIRESNPYNNHSWRKKRKGVYERDNFTCQECYRKCDDAIGIACHHIDFDNVNNKMLNLITLCSSCHGKTIQKPEDWIRYYQDKMMLIENIKKT